MVNEELVYKKALWFLTFGLSEIILFVLLIQTYALEKEVPN